MKTSYMDIILRVEGKGFSKIVRRSYKKLMDFLGKDFQEKFNYQFVAFEEVGLDQNTKHWVWRVKFRLFEKEESTTAKQTPERLANYIANILVNENAH